MKNLLNENKAITLIALVITIVVLIILATVAINISLGQNGIFNRAKQAKQEYANAQDYETKQVNALDDEISRHINVSDSNDDSRTRKITFNSNSGLFSNNETTKILNINYEDPFNIIQEKPIRDGYNFLGWATSSDGNVEYSSGDNCSLQGEIIFYAKWIEIIQLIPYMTSNNTPSGTSSAISCYTRDGGNNHPEWKAFDNSLTTAWCGERIYNTQNSPYWLEYDFGRTVNILNIEIKYGISSSTDSGTNTFVLKYYNGTDWADITNTEFYLDNNLNNETYKSFLVNTQTSKIRLWQSGVKQGDTNWDSAIIYDFRCNGYIFN